MATTDIAYTAPAPNGAVGVELATVPLVAAPTDNMRVAAALPEETLLVVANTSPDTDLTFTITAGDLPIAWAAGQGDLAVTVGFGATVYLGPFESGRFVHSDGSLLLESTAASGTVGAIRVSRKA